MAHREQRRESGGGGRDVPRLDDREGTRRKPGVRELVGGARDRAGRPARAAATVRGGRTSAGRMASGELGRKPIPSRARRQSDRAGYRRARGAGRRPRVGSRGDSRRGHPARHLGSDGRAAPHRASARRAGDGARARDFARRALAFEHRRHASRVGAARRLRDDSGTLRSQAGRCRCAGGSADRIVHAAGAAAVPPSAPERGVRRVVRGGLPFLRDGGCAAGRLAS